MFKDIYNMQVNILFTYLRAEYMFSDPLSFRAGSRLRC